MSKLVWDDAFNIDVLDIDEKMKELFEGINRYLEYDSRRIKEEDYDEIGEVLADISEGIRQHFNHEEKLLIQYRYPEIAGHKKEHRRFVKKVLAFRRVFSEEPEKIYKDSVKYIQEWLLRHIQEDDMRYAPFIRVQKYLMEHNAQSRRGR
ncbi:MAG: bacteriohemerythrin [Proteobacteria bacterium]|nr:bacteriohemerythrin [Pseudomonadota bacterium]